MIKFGSLFAGIGGFELGLEQAGMECAWQVENDSFCNQLLEDKWPAVPKFGDVREIGGNDLESVDLICGGFPCQDLSVAGKLGGLAAERSGLWFEFARIIEELRPAWVIVENVTGLLSSAKGIDLATILQRLAQLGYMGGYRVLNAQHFGVAQRRRRVFIVGHLGTGSAAKVLFEREGLPGNPPPRQKEGQEYSRSLAASSGGASGKESQNTFIINRPLGTAPNRGFGEEEEYLISEPSIYQHASGGGDDLKDTAQALRSEPEHNYQIVLDARGHGDGETVNTLVGDHMNRVTDYTPLVSGAVSPKWAKGSGGPAGDEAYNLVAAPLRSRNSPNSNMPGRGGEDDENLIVHSVTENQRGEVYLGDKSSSLNQTGGKAGQGYPAAFIDQAVRRLTPLECERLQGFPDNWTEGFSDTRRYKMIGNAVVPIIAEWIGRRILENLDG